MDKPFMYGQLVSGNNFTDREQETKRLIMNFKHGVNTIIISPRRIGKTSLVHHVLSELDDENIITLMFDMYDCRDEYDFYNKFSVNVLKSTASSIDNVMQNITEFLGRISPKITLNSDVAMDYSLSLGLSPKEYSAEEILNLPEKIAIKKNKHIIVCIDEFQQIGEFTNSLQMQKIMRSVWQQQQNVSYCFFGSKKHMLENIFSNKRMPFYQFGEMMHLGKIPTEKWVKYIQKQFLSEKKIISEDIASQLCFQVDNYSSYVQQLAWNLFVITDKTATEEGLQTAIEDMLNQNNSFFTEQIKDLTSYQLNFLKAVNSGIHNGFSSAQVLQEWHFGSKSNIATIKSALIEKELIEEDKSFVYIADPVFALWLRKTYL